MSISGKNQAEPAPNWIEARESPHRWEREAIAFLRSHFPAHEPYRAWSNFEFVADDGSINEVDALVFTPEGFFLIEIKSRPGRLSGDPATWTWQTDGKFHTTDNPLILTNTKAKKLRSLLERQRACRAWRGPNREREPKPTRSHQGISMCFDGK